MINSSYRNKMPVRLDHGYRAKEMTQVPWVQGSGFRVQGSGFRGVVAASPQIYMRRCPKVGGKKSDV